MRNLSIFVNLWIFNKSSYYLSFVTLLLASSHTEYVNKANFTQGTCGNNHFKLNFNGECVPFLSCTEISYLDYGDLIGYGAVKKIYKSQWKGHIVAIVFSNNLMYKDDFLTGLSWLVQLSHSQHVAKIIGHCEQHAIYVMEYYPRKSAINFEKYLPNNSEENFHSRLQLAIDYIKIINFLHTTFSSPLVMCDSNSLEKTLEQYLLTNSGSLVLNDMDALTKVTGRGIICGHRPLTGAFLAPEQRWNHSVAYDSNLMSPYNEKSDIWKIPIVCSHFLGNSKEALHVKYLLFNINKLCQNHDPSLRPNSTLILDTYLNIFNTVVKNNIFSFRDEF